MTKEQLDLLFEYIESRVHALAKDYPPDIKLRLSEREKEIKEKIYNQVVTSAK